MQLGNYWGAEKWVPIILSAFMEMKENIILAQCETHCLEIQDLLATYLFNDAF
jgi:hypothetical protein